MVLKTCILSPELLRDLLFFAVCNLAINVVLFLLNYGADVQVKDIKGKTVLQVLFARMPKKTDEENRKALYEILENAVVAHTRYLREPENAAAPTIPLATPAPNSPL